MKWKHHLDPLSVSGTRSFWKPAVCCIKRGLADQAQAQRTLNVCVRRLFVALVSPFVPLPGSYNYHFQRYTRFCTSIFDCTHTKCSCCRLFSQKINRDALHLQLTCWPGLTTTKASSKLFSSVTRQPSMFQDY
jgi:hypothetical protein